MGLPTGLLIFAVSLARLTTGTALLGGLADITLQVDVQSTNLADLLRPFEGELWAIFAVLIGGALIASLAGAGTGRAHTRMALDDGRERATTRRRA